MVVPVVAAFALSVGERLFRLQRIVDDDDVGTASGQHAAGGGGKPIALAGSDELLHRLAMRRQAGREKPPIPGAHHDRAAIAGELVGEILRITDAKDLCRRIEPQTPGREGDRGHQRFQVPRWQVDNQAPDPTLGNCRQLGGDDFEVPICRQAGLRVKLMEAATGEGREVVPQ